MIGNNSLSRLNYNIISAAALTNNSLPNNNNKLTTTTTSNQVPTTRAATNPHHCLSILRFINNAWYVKKSVYLVKQNIIGINENLSISFIKNKFIYDISIALAWLCLTYFLICHGISLCSSFNSCQKNVW